MLHIVTFNVGTMKLVTVFAVGLVLLVGSKSSHPSPSHPWNLVHQQEFPVHPKRAFHQMTHNIDSPLLLWLQHVCHQMRAKCKFPDLEKHGGAIPGDARFALYNGHKIIKLNDPLHYYRLRMV